MDLADTTDLLLEHAHADREIESLSRAVRGTGNISHAFKAFEIVILRHFATEERELFVAYEREEPEDAAVLRAQHESFRALLRKARALVDNGSFGAEQLRELQIAVALHHAHEETGLYAWVRSKPSRWRAPRVA